MAAFSSKAERLQRHSPLTLHPSPSIYSYHHLEVHHLLVAISDNSNSGYLLCASRRFQQFVAYPALPLYNRYEEPKPLRDFPNQDIIKICASFPLTVAIELAVNQYNGTNSSTIFQTHPGFCSAFLIFIMLAFTASWAELRLRGHSKRASRVLAEIAYVCVAVSFTLMIWLMLPVNFRWVAWLSVLPMLASMIILFAKHG
ncbi:hypothetical protein AMTR_s00067p00035650 [Amborella trichopoda]|uniref:Uncharacterized protein n=1 Tax=Amborella trichopoda TaxID=13333 RepID=U5DEC2_AMBTC|nr:hypothetical protein AMTR_s00067p00035650 [Amborella trichopoda]